MKKALKKDEVEVIEVSAEVIPPVETKLEPMELTVDTSVTVTSNSFHHILKCEGEVPEGYVGLASWSFADPILTQKFVFQEGKIETRVFVVGHVTAKRLNKGDKVGVMVLVKA